MKKINYTVLLIDDDGVDRELVARVLRTSKKYVFHILAADNVEDGLNLCLNQPIDCILLDYILKGTTGFDFINQLSSKFKGDLPAIIILTSQGSEEVAVSFLHSGAMDYVRKERLCLPTLETAMINSIKKHTSQQIQKEHAIQFHYQASHDELTHLANRRELNRMLTRYISASKRHHRTMALLFCDLDNFKYVNDTFGHTIGDQLLKKVATRLKKCLRESDFSARVGGDEFIIILDEPGHEQDIARIASNICQTINKPFIILGQTIKISISIGIVCMTSDTVDPLELMNKADTAMYRAKHSGANTYHFYSQGSCP